MGERTFHETQEECEEKFVERGKACKCDDCSGDDGCLLICYRNHAPRETY